MDTIWIYLAMVAILGIRWLFEQLKRGAERRRQMLEGKMGREPESVEDYYQETVSSPPPVPAQQQQPQQQPSAPQTLQELFEQRRQEIAQHQRQAASPPKPDPQQAQVAEVPEQPESVVTPTPSVPNEIELNSPFLLGSETSKVEKKRSGVSKTLSDLETVRSAIVLNEVLGKPKGLY